MRLKNFSVTVLFLYFFIFGVLNAADVKTLQYRSQKVSKYNQQIVHSESMVLMDGERVKLSFLIPEKRTVILNNSVYVVEYPENTQPVVNKYKLSEVPMVIKQILVPSIFGASTFFQNLEKGFQIKSSAVSPNIYVAVPNKQKNISKVEYMYDKVKDQLYYYKIYAKDGGLISETRFSDYKTFNNSYIFPTKIQTIINGKDGVIEENEVFSRIRVDLPVAQAEFDIQVVEK